MSAFLVSNYACARCDKTYTNKSDAKRHVIMCEELSKTSRQRKIEEERNTDLPTHDQLCHIVMDLLQKNIALEKKLSQITQWAERNQKKVVLTDWLNDNVRPRLNYAEFKDQLGKSVNQNHVEYLIKNTFIDTTLKIFEDFGWGEGSPIFCSTQKQNVFYMHQSDQSLSASDWVEMTKTDLVDLLNYLHSKFLRELMKWHRENADIIAKNEQVCKQYTKMMIKFSEIEFSNDTTLSKIKTGLYNQLKKDLRDI
jgi:hypothetical protein